jgi:molecular chaperone GrpE
MFEESRNDKTESPASTEPDDRPVVDSEDDQPLNDLQDDNPNIDDSQEALKQERNELQDRLLRTAAEFDNYRKRIERERQEVTEAIGSDVLSGLLPIIDDLERALKAPDTSDSAVYRKGVELIHKQMLDLLHKRGATPIEALGTDFDPRFHQAVAHDISPEHRENEVIEEFRRGYMIGDRLLRAAMVKVAKA